MDLGLTGRRIVVGGASRGLGAAIATVVAAEGAKVAAIARPSPDLAAQSDLIGAFPIPAGLSDPAGPTQAIEQAIEALGGMDGLVVNSGGPPLGTFDALYEAAWLQAIDGTLLAAIRLIRAGLPALRESDAPAIVVVLSSSVREP